MWSMVNLPNHTFTGQASNQLAVLTQQKGQNEGRIAADQAGVNSQPPDHKSDVHPTQPPRLA